MTWVSYEELKSWQAAIGSATGFVALIAAAVFNFHLTRRRDAESRREETSSVAAALYGELLLLEGQLAQAALAVASLWHEGRGRGFGEAFLDVYQLPSPVLYPSLANKLGLLDPEIVLSITAFHADFQFARTALPLIMRPNSAGPAHGVVLFLRPAVEAIEKLQSGLELLETVARVRRRRRPQDLRPAQELLEHEM